MAIPPADAAPLRQAGNGWAAAGAAAGGTVADDCSRCCESDASAVSAAPTGLGRVAGWLGDRTRLTVIAGVTLGIGLLLSWAGPRFPGWLDLHLGMTLYRVVLGVSMLAGAVHPLRAGIRALRRGFSFDINLLMVVAVAGAAFLGEWAEGAMVAFLFSVGEVLEARTVQKTRRSIGELMDLAPAEAWVRRGGDWVRVSAAGLQPGERVLVKPGERIPTDGVVEAGNSAVNQAPITGESLPVDRGPGDPVYAGTVNGHGALEVVVTRPAGDSTLARVIRLVATAQTQKAPAQRLVDTFARVYTPAVLAVAAAVAVLPPLALNEPFAPWAYRALTLLLISCPCAFVLATPVSVVAAIGGAARHGVLIKSGAHLEAAGRLRAIALDKTGTLTRGVPEVTGVVPLDGLSPEELLSVAAAVEQASEHPLAAAIVAHARQTGITPPEAAGFTAIPGRGARARVGEADVFVGSPRLFAEAEALGIPEADLPPTVAALQGDGKTVVLVGSGGRLLGALALADRPRGTSRAVVGALRRAGLAPVVMLTGDHPETARAVAAAVGVDRFQAGCLPEEKLAAIKELRAKHGRVAMVGDGINDAPALAAATVGIAMGGAGSAAALEAADIVLMGDDLARLPFTLRLSRRAVGIIRQNVAFALGAKLAAVALMFPGWLTLWMAVLADIGATLVVVANGMRLLRHKP